MSRSDSVASTDTSSTIYIGSRRTGLAPSGSRVNTPYSYVNKTKDYLHQPKSQQPPPLSRHYATLQEHADSVTRGVYVDIDAPTPRHEIRRESFAWGLRMGNDEMPPMQSRNPMMPHRTGNSSPPSMEELIRRTTVDDDDSSSTRRSSVMHDVIFSRPSSPRSSTTGTDIDSLTRTDTGKSIGALARSMTRRIPDVKTHRSRVEQTTDTKLALGEESTDDAQTSHGRKKSRKLSFQLPSGLKMNHPLELPQKPLPVTEESPATETPAKTTSPDTPSKCSGLAARRQIKMDLTLPLNMNNLSSCAKHKGTTPGISSSITPSRPRSPKTPWIREKEHNWNLETKPKAIKTAPIVEEIQAYVGTMDVTTLGDAGLVPGAEPMLPPVTAPSLPSTPRFIRPPQKVRDRCYISRPPGPKRNKSGGPSTSESDFGSTPDGHWTPEVKEGMTEQEARTQSELVELTKAAKTARSRRWPWNKSKASGSDEHTSDERNDSRRSISVNVFKRSSRFRDILEKEMKQKKPSRGIDLPWRRKNSVSKPPLPSASLANMPVPPVFVPPGTVKVPTPPTFDPAGEVRGKLADFFFESGAFPLGSKRKAKPSPGGYWDSNAVLMSMHTDLELTNNEDDEEGPEGRPPAAFHFGPVNDTPGLMTSPGLFTAPDGYLAVKGVGFGGGSTPLTPGTAQDSWFRMHYGDHTSDEDLLTATALKEADEKRKFEWLVPEHLPNSPICPLHPKYVGPSKGLCYWHGRKSNGWGVEPGRNYVSHPVQVGGGNRAGWETGKVEGPKNEKKKRRLQSLSNPSRS